MPESLAQFFRRVTTHEILPYQLRYGSDPFRHTLLFIPTGLGKTDAVLVPWLHAVEQQLPAPRRLVIVQPRQNLTEQTAERARLLASQVDSRIRVIELMAGSDDNELTLGPDEYAIIVGTQDMVLSGALNRRYARRPPRWPIDFALFNNDALLIFDEVQLASDGLATSTQLAAFRQRFGTFGLTAVQRVRELWQADDRPAVQCVIAWQGLVSAEGSPKARRDDPLFSLTTCVETVTPFVTGRHWKRKVDFNEFLREEIRRECVNHGLPVPVQIERQERLRGLFDSIEFRRNRKDDPPRPGYAFRLTFNRPMPAPFTLGYGCHFGLGQFAPC